jgi:S-(hydroxymethyl)glutathione dehydrogenase/alcohol dehydrogenase
MMRMPEKMTAAILVRQKQPLVIDEVTLPRALDYGQVLVKVKYSGICGSQIGEIDGVKGEDRFLPHLLGHEGSGIVLETGAGVKHVQAGDRVVLHWRKGAGIEANPPTYLWKQRQLNAGYVTTFNQYTIASENRLTRIPDDFDLRLAMLFGCAVTTGMGVITNNARMKIGQSVVVFGTGGVGLNVIQGAALGCGHPIIAVDIHDAKLALARKLGATHVINSRQQNPEAEIAKILAGGLADVVIDNTGIVEVTSLAVKLTAPQGKTIMVGVPQKGKTLSIDPLPLFFGKTLTGSHGGESAPAVDIPQFIRLHQAGKLNLDDLITDTFQLSEINTAIEKMRAGDIRGRCIIEL